MLKTGMTQKKRISTVLVYILFVVMMLLTISNKENYHVDEIFSYGLSNHHGDSIDISFEQGIKYEPVDAPFMNYLTVDSEARFDYTNVWKNQSMDVHPPLYYAILHTICSLFPGSFSIWYAGIINIVAAIAVLYFLRKLVNILTDNDEQICLLVSVAFVVSSGILVAVSFLRMYILTMLWATILIYILTREIGKKSSNWKFFLFVYLAALAGALTHYYCIIFTVFACGIYCIYLLVERKLKSIVGIGIVGVSTFGTAYLIFPSIVEHVFSTDRGSQSLNNWKENSLEVFGERLRGFYSIIDRDLFGNLFIYILFVFIAAMVFYLIKNRKSGVLVDASKRISIIRYILILVPSILYFILVAKIAVYYENRYMFPIYAVLFLGSVCLVCSLFRMCLNRKVFTIVAVMLVALITVSGWKNAKWSYLYKRSEAFLETVSEYSDLDCLCIYNDKWETNPSFAEISKYKSVTFVKTDNLELLSSLDIASKPELIVSIVSDREAVLNKIMEEYPQLTNYEEVGGFCYSMSYHLYGDS